MQFNDDLTLNDDVVIGDIGGNNVKDDNDKDTSTDNTEEKEIIIAHKGEKRVNDCQYIEDKRTRDVRFNTMRDRMRKAFEKIGIITGCYGILFLRR